MVVVMVNVDVSDAELPGTVMGLKFALVPAGKPLTMDKVPGLGWLLPVNLTVTV